MVRKSVMFSNVIVDIAFPRRSFVFSQSGCEVEFFVSLFVVNKVRPFCRDSQSCS